MKEKLRIIPLGGLGQIGMNMMVVQSGRSAFLVDCGVMFADEHVPGIDLIVPDFSYLLNSDVDLLAIVLTHGHEDHIGAVPFLLRELNVPVFGSKFTLELVRKKLREHELLAKADLRLVKEKETISLGPFGIEFIAMSHSIADALALAIDTPLGKVIHTGDFKIDPSPVDGRKTDLAWFKKQGDKGVYLLLSDSTNVENEGPSVSESSVYKGLAGLVRDATGWVILASFASHIPRMMQVIKLAQETNRKICVAGRSMIDNLGIARQLGYIQCSDDLFVDIDEAASLPRRRLIILSTGTQGEPRSALARMAYDEHKQLRVRHGDRVILSSRFIPGNERAIFGIMNHLYRRGAEVLTTKGAQVHVSGHAYRGDLEKMLRAVRPRFFVPVHGEYRHLVKHAELARETGVHDARTLVLEDGDVAEFSRDRGRIVERMELQRSVVDGKELADIGSVVLRDRRHLAFTGLVVVVVVIDSHSGKVLRGPELFSRGVAFENDADELFAEAREVVEETLDEFGAEAMTDDHGVQEEIRIAVRRFFKNQLDRKPVVIPIVIEV